MERKTNSHRRMATLQGRIMKIIVLIALLVSGIGLGISTVHEIRSMRESQIRINDTAAKLTAEHSITALSFGYPDKAKEILDNLVKQQSINACYIFDKNGNLFAASTNSDHQAPPLPKKGAGYKFIGDTLDIWEPVMYEEKQYGTVLLRKETGLYKKLLKLAATNLLLLVGLLVIAFLLATRLTTSITLSIRKIADIADKASVDDEYPTTILDSTQIVELSVLSSSLRRMFGRLRQNQEETTRQDWLKSGEVELADYLRHDLPLTELGDQTLGFIARYVNAQAGALFFRQEQLMVLTAGYAFRKRKANDNVFQLGEGMVGQAALEKKTIIFSEVPPDHLNLLVDSGFGTNDPTTIIVIPLIYNNEVQGVLELAKTTTFSEKEANFLEQAAAGIAITLYTANNRTVTEDLLAETQRQSIELQTRQEELKTAYEELEEQTAELLRSEKLLQEQREELQAANKELTEKSQELIQEREAIAAELRQLQEEQTNQTSAKKEVASSPGRNDAITVRTVTTAKGGSPLPADTPEDDRFSLSPLDKRALIIEDDPAFAHILKKIATQKGYKVLLAEQGREGLLLAEKHLPQAIILDLGLPDMDGMQVLRNLKQSPKTRNIPVHIASAHDRNMDTLQKGAIGYLGKPASTTDINKIFERFDQLAEGILPRLLIVEKDNIGRRETIQLFKDRQVEINATSRGKEVEELLLTRNFEAIILNLDLPDMDGIELLEQLNSRNDLELPPVIVYTDRVLTHAELTRFEQKVSSIIVKGPDSRERLLDEVSLFLHSVTETLPNEKKNQPSMYHSEESILSGKKVLVVDDDSRNIFALSKVLKRENMIVVAASDGHQALTLLNENPDTSLVLMDIMMPRMDGYETTRCIRLMEEFEKLPILALTAKAMRGDRDKCLEAGASDYLAKPVDTEKLLSMIRVWIGR